MYPCLPTFNPLPKNALALLENDSFFAPFLSENRDFFFIYLFCFLPTYPTTKYRVGGPKSFFRWKSYERGFSTIIDSISLFPCWLFPCCLWPCYLCPCCLFPCCFVSVHVVSVRVVPCHVSVHRVSPHVDCPCIYPCCLVPCLYPCCLFPSLFPSCIWPCCICPCCIWPCWLCPCVFQCCLFSCVFLCCFFPCFIFSLFVPVVFKPRLVCFPVFQPVRRHGAWFFLQTTTTLSHFQTFKPHLSVSTAFPFSVLVLSVLFCLILYIMTYFLTVVASNLALA